MVFQLQIGTFVSNYPSSQFWKPTSFVKPLMILEGSTLVRKDWESL